MRIVAISDMHGELPEVPACDVLLIAGDICPVGHHAVDFQAEWLRTEFRRWLERVPARHVAGVAGNHDFIFERQPELVPGDLRWRYLNCTSVEIEGLLIWGSPWQPWFYDWAFNAPATGGEKFLADIYFRIPDGTDVVISHGPPAGYGDRTTRGNVTGSSALLQRLLVLKPRLTVFGHIHEARGRWDLGWGILANVSILNEKYEAVHPPMEFEISSGG